MSTRAPSSKADGGNASRSCPSRSGPPPSSCSTKTLGRSDLPQSSGTSGTGGAGVPNNENLFRFLRQDPADDGTLYGRLFTAAAAQQLDANCTQLSRARAAAKIRQFDSSFNRET